MSLFLASITVLCVVGISIGQLMFKKAAEALPATLSLMGFVQNGWLLAALVCSLAGDLFLMLPNPALFLPGLVSFLLAHIAYIVAFRQQGIPWFANRAALAVIALIAAAMYAFLYTHGLPAEMRIPVAVYIGVIVLMAAQAWGRWTVLRNSAALQVAIGASLFMLSDSILAIDRFVQPVDFALFWVLITYFAAQVLILCGMTAPSNTANHAGKHQII